jgi:iron complex outermembrane receptor protein
MIRWLTAYWLAGLGLMVGAVGMLGQVRDTLPSDTTVFQMQELRVRATRPIASTSGGSAVRLDLQSPRVQAVPLLSEALRDMPFVQVRTNSRGEAQLTLRGTGSRQVAVLVDGIPLTLGWDARSDLSMIPVDAAREVQFFRGISSVLHGPNVLGGVVAIDIAREDVDPDARLNGFQAAVDETGGTVIGGRLGRSWSFENGGFSLQAGGGARSRDGVPIPGGIAQPVTSRAGTQLNSDLEHLSAFLTGRYETAPGAWLALSIFGYEAERGVPPELHVFEPRRWRIPDTKRLLTALSVGTAWGRTPFGTGDFEVSLGIDLGESQIDEFETLAYQTVTEQEFSDDRTLTLRVLSDHTIGPGILRTALTWADARHVEQIDPSESTSTFRQRLFSLGAEVELPMAESGSDFWSGANLSAGVSFDGASTPETGGRSSRSPINDWGARVGGSAWLGDATRLHVGMSRKVRFPSLRELYSGALGRFVPNPDLKPEVLGALEAGLTGTGVGLGGKLETQAVLFDQRFSDAIVRTGLGDGQFQRQNRNRVRATGLELLGTISWSATELGGNVTWQNVRLTDELRPARQSRAEYQPELFGSVHLTAPLLAGFRGRASVDLVGRQFCVDPEQGMDTALTRTGHLDFLVSREWSLGNWFRAVQASISFDNVTDSVVFDQCGLPRPGRLFRLQLRLF